MSDDPVVMTVPVEGYENVVRLVAGGFASRLDFGFEAVDDIQLAIELALRSIPDRSGSVTISLLDDRQCFRARIVPVEGLSLDQPLRALDGGGMELGASLERLLDGVELSGDPDTALLLSRKLPGQA